MTSPLSFSSRLCSKPLKRLLYDCQCLLTCVCLLCTDKVHRWKFFHHLCDFLWQFTWAYLSVKWVINLFTSHTTSFFLSSSTSSLITFVCEIFLNWICYTDSCMTSLAVTTSTTTTTTMQVLYRYVSQSWYLTEFLFFTMCMLLFSLLWLLMKIQFSLLISSSSLSTLTFLKQESFLHCSVWMFCLYNFISC